MNVTLGAMPLNYYYFYTYITCSYQHSAEHLLFTVVKMTQCFADYRVSPLFCALALLHRKRASARTTHDSCHAQRNHEMGTGITVYARALPV
jgi:hypothetical protein